jgi:hypothetical protein
LREKADVVGTIEPRSETVMRKLSWWLTALTVVVLGTGIARAQQQAQPPQQAQQAQQKSPQIEPDAMAALQKMGTYLRSLKAFQVNAVTSNEDVLEDGQKVQFTAVTNLLAQMPNRLRISVDSDRRNRDFIYDGKQLTVMARRVNYYATVPAPPTIVQLSDMLDEKYNLQIPLEDLFRWGGQQSRDKDITSAMFIGPSDVDDVTCGHYAFRQAGLDWQVWIQLGDFPLPRKLVITTLTDEARPQYVATYDWNLAPSFSDASFTFVPPPGAGKVVLETEAKK